MHRRHTALALALAFALGTSGCAWITRASRTGSSDADGASAAPSLSADGRFVAFASDATNLVGGDTNMATDVFVRDNLTNTVERVSLATGGSQGDGASAAPSISGDGRYVAFASAATNLVPEDGSPVGDVFRYDRDTDTIERVATGSDAPSISSDGSRIVFVTGPDVFVANLTTPSTTLVSANATRPSISPDGTRVAYQSGPDVFVKDLAGGAATRVSVSFAGGDANGASTDPDVADDGSVAFTSTASDLTAPGTDTNSAADVFVHSAGQTSLVSIGANAASGDAALSTDGRYVVFTSDASTLVPGDTNGATDVFIRDRSSGATQRASTEQFLGEANGASSQPDVSGNGRYVAFASMAGDLDPTVPDVNGVADVFVRAAFVPTVLGMSPDSLPAGVVKLPFFIRGEGFQAGAKVFAANATFTITSVSDTQIAGLASIEPGAPAGPRKITVTIPGTGGGVATGAGADCLCLRVTTSGAMWFTNAQNDRIGRVTTDGAIQTWADPAGNVDNPRGITLGFDGNLWFVSRDNNRIGRITPQGVITTFTDPNISTPVGITAAADGNMWFTNFGNDSVARITPDGVITTFFDPTGNFDAPHGINTGPDGNLWVPAQGSDRMARITLDGTITSFPDATGQTDAPNDSWTGADGNIWFTNFVNVNNRIGRVTPDGSYTSFVDPANQILRGLDITAGPDGNLWFTSNGNNRVGRITLDGTITTYTAQHVRGPRGIVTGPDGNVWFTIATSNRIGRITPGGNITTFTDPAGNVGLPIGIVVGP
jgi:streptogramin lyase/Tol biopolymer transport system component